MGFLSRMRFVRDVATADAAPASAQDFTAGPSVSLADVIAIAGGKLGANVTREEALSVPAVLRGRNLVCNIATLPLVTLDPARKPVRESLFDQIDPDVPNVVTLAMTFEDLLFDGIAWWQVLARGWNDFPSSARHIDSGRVTLQPPSGGNLNPLPSGVDPASVVWVDGRPVLKRDVIRFDSPNPGILKAARRTIRRAIRFEETAEMYAGDPRALEYFTRREGGSVPDPSPEQIRRQIGEWIAARRERATAYVPDWLEHNTVDAPSPADLQLVELQRQVALDLANVLSIDPEDLGVSTTSRTYQNATDRRQDRINDMLASYMRAMTDRLSMNDVTRRGYRTTFDLADYMKADPTTRWSVYDTAVRLGVMDLADVAEAEDLPEKPRRTPQAPAPQAAPAAPTEEVTPVQNAAHDATQTFSALDGPTSLTLAFDVDPTTFKADQARRTISGLLLPFGAVGRNAQGRFRFAPGSVDWSKAAVSRIKLNDEHDRKALLGAATVVKATDGGVVAEFKVRRGPEGDAALMAAEDGVQDGLSAEVDILDYAADPENDGVYLVTRARLTGAALTGTPAFDDARLTSVAASNTEGNTVMPDATTGQTAPAAPAAPSADDLDTRIAAAVSAALAQHAGGPAVPAPAPEGPAVVDPAVRPVAFVREELPYQFDRGGNFSRGDHEFSSDLVAMLKAKDNEGTGTDAGKRVMGLLQATFATVASDDVNELNPNIQRPDMYVDQRDYRTPLWDMVSKGAPPNGVQPFTFPKFSSSSGLVGDHTEETEPTAGSFVTTSQTVTPTALSGKASLTRETWDMGGNPAVSTLVFNQMRRGYFEGLESATATFLNTLTAATDIALTTAAVDDALAADWDAALAGLQFVRGYDFSALALEQVLYKAFVGARDGNGRVLYPILAPSNANGTAQSRFRSLDLGGVTGVPSWALASTPGSANNSWLFDPSTVHGWATAPQRLEFAGTAGDGSYAPVAFIDLAIWGYKAFANSDIGGVRQVTYDSVA